MYVVLPHIASPAEAVKMCGCRAVNCPFPDVRTETSRRSQLAAIGYSLQQQADVAEQFLAWLSVRDSSPKLQAEAASFELQTSGRPEPRGGFEASRVIDRLRSHASPLGGELPVP
jgi:hypothetical protein